jgi:hypothetical protein
MENLYSAWPEDSKEDNRNEQAYRLLRKLKYALLFWLVSFIVTIIWFTNSPAF